MSDNTRNDIKRYIVIQRCKPYGLWPRFMRFESPHLPYQMRHNGNKYDLRVQFMLETYEQLESHSHSVDMEKRYGRVIMPFARAQGFWLGDAIVVEPGEKFPMGFRLLQAITGECDFVLYIEAREPLDTIVLAREFEPVLLYLASYVAQTFDDIVLPLYEVDAHELVNENSTSNAIGPAVVIHQRPVLQADDLKHAFRKCVEGRVLRQPELKRRVCLAAKRCMKAEQEFDPVDKYCDLWEACEFLAIRDDKIKGGGAVDARISYYLCEHTKHKKTYIVAMVKTMYYIRCDLVHNAIERPVEVNRMISVLEHVSRELLKYWMGLPYDGSHRIEAYLREQRTGKPSGDPEVHCDGLEAPNR